MSQYIEVIAQLKQKNNADFPLADVNDLKGGYIQVETMQEMEAFLQTSKLKEGMLCYVKQTQDDTHMFQYRDGTWNPWVPSGGGGGTGGMSIKIVDSLEDLNDEELKIKGQIVFVDDIDEIRYYTGEFWESFSKIYIQDTPPEDTGGIWIDTSENKEHMTSNTVIQDLLKVIYILQEKVERLEFAFTHQIDSGDFKNNQYYEYDGAENEEPNYGTSEEEDNAEQEANKDVVLADSPEPVEYQDYLPNAKHICIKSGTYAEMITNKDDFLPKELLWCYDKQALYIKDPKTYKLIKIGSTDGTDPDPDPEYMEGILTEVIGSGSQAKTKIVGIEFADMSNKENTYLIQVKDGKLDVHDYRLDKNTLAGNSQTVGTGIYYTTPYFPIISEEVGSKDSPKIYVNMVYCGGESEDKDYNPVSHNFIELCNLGKKDLNLKGLYLHYTERNTGDWVTLPLIGTLKSQGTFLIRGAQCSVMNINTTILKVGEPDMYWTKDSTLNNDRLDIDQDQGAGVQAHSIWSKDGLIKFSYDCAFYISGEESQDYFKNNVLNTNAPWTSNGVIKWYVDLVGIGSYEDRSMPCEASSIPNKGSNILLMRYYNMDPVKQATKALSARSNVKDWTYINLDNINPAINIQDYVPKNSSEHKDIFFNKNLLQEGAPNIITCTLGHNAHTTRCFNWISVGYYDEYIWIRKEGEDEYLPENKFESFKKEDITSEGESQNPNRPKSHKNWTNSIYNRIRSITTDGTPFTVHKFIKDFEEPTDTQKYYYKVGREGAWSEERSFTLRNRDKVIENGFNFLQVSDQQGFNSEEYETWRVCAEFINSEKESTNYEWCLNTGDQTQNGNRFNEWIDYYKGGSSIYKDTEQMYSVGNNDLCPVDVYTLGDGEDKSKTNPANVEFFFTFEHPYTVPISSAGVYIPCVYSFVYGNTYFLSMNSEITELARTDVFKDQEGVNVYNDLKTWATNDLAQHVSDDKISWKVAFCHEAPFTIITADLIMSYLKQSGEDGYVKDPDIKRGGSHLNTVGNYWFSQWLQDNGFKLCLCGHKHTYSNSRYLREDPEKTMEPIVYDPSESPTWYTSLPEREKQCVQLSTNKELNYVKYVMCQATGYKLISNKELPAKNIPWLLEYYPVSSQVENPGTNTATVKVNSAQQYPNYIIWNIGKGTEQEIPFTSTEERERILGKSYKIQLKSDTKLWSYKYNVPISYTELKKVGGNGSVNPDNNIIIEKVLS